MLLGTKPTAEQVRDKWNDSPHRSTDPISLGVAEVVLASWVHHVDHDVEAAQDGERYEDILDLLAINISLDCLAEDEKLVFTENGWEVTS